MTDAEIERAAEALRGGKLVVLPTDTVYGLGARPETTEAIEKIYRAKGRPLSKPIAILAASIGDLQSVAVFDDQAISLAERHWPGPLTLVLARAPGFTAELGGRGSKGVAVRVPASGRALELLRLAGPTAVTSANRSGEQPAQTMAEARAALGAWVDVFVDGGTCSGDPSTVVSLLGELRVLRPGPIAIEPGSTE